MAVAAFGEVSRLFANVTEQRATIREIAAGQRMMSTGLHDVRGEKQDIILKGNIVKMSFLGNE